MSQQRKSGAHKSKRKYKFKSGSKILRRPVVKKTAGVSDSFIDRGIKDGTFPAPVKLGARAVGWPDFVIYEWLSEREVVS